MAGDTPWNEQAYKDLSIVLYSILQQEMTKETKAQMAAGMDARGHAFSYEAIR